MILDAFFTNKAKIMNEQRLSENVSYKFSIQKSLLISTNFVNRKSFCYTDFSKIYHELGINTFLSRYKDNL